ncbi:uncharacterized protein LOC135849963 [Planococcus citri]|uniref:uncharacterized protein LOC135849963 n=1 Tax=Planococcus citri TaxID=170843 RepID=UPI0031F88FF1
MDAPLLSYNPHVEEFAGRSLTFRDSEDITFEEACSDSNLRRRALQFYRSTPTRWPPLEFTQFVLRNSAINERGCCHFEKQLPFEVRKCLKGLIGRENSDIVIRQVHGTNKDSPSGFRGVFVKYFFKKVIHNLRNQIGRYDYAENFATVFPFKVLDRVPVQYDIEVMNVLDNDFYDQIQTFLDDHFDNVDAREICASFLSNVLHFKTTRFPEEALTERVTSGEGIDTKNYLSSFPRLSKEGIRWYRHLYDDYKNVCKIFDNVDVSLDIYDDNYFQTLPESNFVDLYELLSKCLYAIRRKQYIERFKKYLFFFVHALGDDSNPVFFIDDVLFECLKSLRKFKTSPEDVSLASEVAKLSLVHLRTKAQMDESANNSDIFRMESNVLLNIKTYVQSIPDIETAEIDVEYKTDYLHGWMLLRNRDTCYEMCYSKRKRNRIDDFISRILCGVLPPDDELIKYVVMYNSYTGEESRLEMPSNIENIRNFIRLSNKHDFTNDTQAESNDAFLTRDVEKYFNCLKIAD